MKFLFRKQWQYSKLLNSGPPSPLLSSSFSLPSAPPRFPLRVIFPVTALLFVVVLLLSSNDASSGIPTRVGTAGGAPVTREAIPNQVHFVYILPNANANFAFEFSHFLCIYATWFYWRPEQMFLHTNALANSSAVARARDGEAGKWNEFIFSRFDLKINTVEVPTRARNGKEIQGMEHKSDFVRVEAVHELGGVYIDWDVHPLRDVRVLRESGFKAVAGRQLGGQINSGMFMSERGGRMIGLWMEGMHEAYSGGWTTHSNEVITKYGERLVGEPGEMLIMEQEAFSPGSWNNDDTDALFAVHADEPSNLANMTTRGEAAVALPWHEEGFADRWQHPELYPSWARDWSRSYVLHAFSPGRWGHRVEGFDHITPRYVLERRSNFARAVYPMARQMYEEGLIGVEDTHLGW